MDQMVVAVQQWLNKTYSSNSGYSNLFPGGISEDGVTGTQVEQALVAALQIEEGISSPTGTFGPTTTADFTTMSCRSSSEISNPPTNKEYILQGGFWCKGYNPGGFSGVFYTGTQSAVEQFQSDAGLSTQDGVVTAMIIKALLNTDPFVLSSHGDSRIREIQQDLNNRYNAYTGLLPTNGIYVAATNKALIYALQAEEGLSTSVANGSFGSTTQKDCPTLSAGDSRTNFVKILEYALYCNHYDPGDFNGAYSSSVTSAVESFQSFMRLPVTGVANMATIKATLTSNGDISRSAQACDCATILTAAKAATLVQNGYQYVGRYLTGTVGNGISKALTAEEVQIIFSAGLNLFIIYESHGSTNSYFTSSQGSSDAYAAIAAAENLGVPSGTVIYFAVDYDALDSQVTSNVLPYFQAIKSYFDNYNTQSYQVGIYGDRNVASRVCNSGYAVYSFVADMSTGYSGNIGFTMPTNWSFDQFYTVTIGSGDGQIEIDKDAYSGRNSGITKVTVSANTPQVNSQPSVQPKPATKQDPVDTSTGAHMLHLTALKVHGAIDLSMDLSYNSTKLASGTMGKGWYHNYEMKVVPVYSSYYVYWNPSVYSVFTAASSGNYTCSDLGKQNDILTVNSNGTFTLNLNNDTIYSFNSSGVLTRTQNRTGMNITVSNDTSGNLVLTEPISGQTLTISYNTSGLVGSVSDKSGRQVSFGYDSNACLTTITDANGKSTTFTYDTSGHVLTGTDGDNVLFFTDTYDSSGRIATQKDAISGSNASTFSYDTTSVSGEMIVTVTDRNGNTSKNVFNSTTLQLISATDENGNTTTYAYDTNGNLTKETDALGNATTTTYDSQNHPLVVTDRTGSKTTNTYDAKGNKLTVTNPDSGEITYAYDSNNRVTNVTDLRSTQTTYTYDSNGLLTEKDYGSEKTINSYTSGLLSKLTNPNGNITSYAYDEAGRLTSVTDAKENLTAYTYDAVGNQLSKTDPLGGKVSTTYSSRGVVLTQTDANGNTTTSVYNGNLKLVSVTDPKGNRTTYSYDGEDHLIQVTDAQRNAVSATYDPAGRVLSRTDAVGNTIRYTYDAVGNVLTTTNSKGGITTDTYYANGKKKTETDPAENQTTYGYDSGWRLNAVTNALGKTTSYVYNNAGDLLSVTDPLGNKTAYTYDAYGNRFTATDPNGNVTTYAYDLNNNQTSVKNALGNTTIYTYDVLNRRTKVTDANGHSTTTAYDAVGRVVSQTDASGNTSSTTYDSNGNVIKQTDALGNVIFQTTYDTTNLPVTVKDALGNTTLNTYDSLKRLTQTEDPLTNITAYGYNANGKIVSATDPMKGVSSAAYDADGNQTSVTNPLGGSFNYAYDDSNRSTSESTTSGGTISYTYNALNLLSEMVNARSQKRDYTYDDAGRIKSFADPEGTTSYTYDANGNILTVADTVGMITRQYDALNRVIKVTDTSGNVVQYTYDAVGNLTSLIYPDGKTVSYTYDASNRMLTVTDWASRITQYTYDANGRLTKTIRPDGSVLTQSYDAAGRLTSAVDKGSSGNTISNYSYTHDANGNILTEDMTGSSTDNASMTYDALNRLTAKSDKDSSGNALASYAYAYDADGNITSGTSSQQTATMAYDKLDRLSTYNSQTPTFDLDGNMTVCVLSGSTVDFAYDSGNRLIQAGTTAYVYDANDNRVSATTSGQKTQYVYENVAARLSQLLVRTASDSSKTFYVYGLGLIGHQDSSGYSVYHYDYRGSTIALTDSNGTVTDRFSYGAYGEILTHTGSINTPFQYNGYDGVITESNGLYFMRARYYTSEIKRFINVDPQLNIQILNRNNVYAFASGNPINFGDPTGNSSETYAEPTLGDDFLSYIKNYINDYSFSQQLIKGVDFLKGNVKFVKRNGKYIVYGKNSILEKYGINPYVRRFNVSNLENYDEIASIIKVGGSLSEALEKSNLIIAGAGIAYDTISDVSSVKSNNGKLAVGAADIALGAGGTASSVVAGAAVGASIGSVVPGLGTLVGLGVGVGVSLLWSHFVQDPAVTYIKNHVQ